MCSTGIAFVTFTKTDLALDNGFGKIENPGSDFDGRWRVQPCRSFINNSSWDSSENSQMTVQHLRVVDRRYSTRKQDLRSVLSAELAFWMSLLAQWNHILSETVYLAKRFSRKRFQPSIGSNAKASKGSVAVIHGLMWVESHCGRNLTVKHCFWDECSSRSVDRIGRWQITEMSSRISRRKISAQ